jgi:hypothetical protein
MRGFNSLSAVGECALTRACKRILLQCCMIFFLRGRWTKIGLEASFIYNKWCTNLIFNILT